MYERMGKDILRKSDKILIVCGKFKIKKEIKLG